MPPNLLQCSLVLRISGIWAVLLDFILFLLKLPLCLSSISKEGESSGNLGNVSQCLVTLNNKKVFPMFQTELPVFLPVLIARGPVTGHLREAPGSVCLAPSGFGLHGRVLIVGEPTPDGFKTDPPLAKAELISDGGRTPGITRLGREETPTVEQETEES